MAMVRLYFDYIDPGSFLAERRLERAAGELDLRVERTPFEVRPPPEALIDPDDSAWGRYWEGMVAEARTEGMEFRAPSRIPWTRKAHELGLHARQEERFESVHRRLYEAFLLEGRDLGRVDHLVALAVECGMDAGEVKVALDVDRHTAELARLRDEARAMGVAGVPTLVAGDRLLEGVPASRELDAFLKDAVRTNETEE